MTISCFHCNTTTTLDLNFEALTFVCPSCFAVYKNNNHEGFKYADKLKSNSFVDKFDLGKSATFNEKEYTITGILIKRAYGSFDWIEYVLESKSGEYLYLSEAGGHWILLNEMVLEKISTNRQQSIDHDGMEFNCYDYCYPELISAKGFFDFDITTKTELIEYINPPFVISVEKTGKEQTAFLGKHITRREIKKAFEVSDLPAKNGIGLVQPFVFDLRNLGLIFCSVALLIVLTNWYLNSDRVEKQVLNTDMPYENYNGKDFISPSFELNGSAAPLTISVFSNVDNSWANVQVALINESTSEETYANKDIEYYHGYTDGESWSEGGTSEEFNLCGVSGGKYHLVLTPMKAPEDVTSSSMHVSASWNKPSLRNVWLVMVFMGVFMIIIFYLDKTFEKRRWEDSSYSPYNENE